MLHLQSVYVLLLLSISVVGLRVVSIIHTHSMLLYTYKLTHMSIGNGGLQASQKLGLFREGIVSSSENRG